MVEAVGIGDLHLSNHLGNGGLSKYIDNSDAYVCSEVRRVLTYADRKNISHVFFYGDICEGARMSYEAQLAFSALLNSYGDQFTFWIIPGNHDMYGRTPEMGHSLQLLDAFNANSHVKYMFQPRDVRIDGSLVRFLPFPSYSFSPKALNICHVDVYGAVADSGRQILNEERDRSNHLIVAGHIHTNQVVRNTYYSGTLYQTCFGEQPEKFFHHIQFSSPKDFEISSVPFESRYRLLTVTVQGPDDIPKNVSKHDLVKLVIQDGANVQAADYAHLNVVMVRTFQSRKQLAAALTEDLPSNGSELRLSTKEFFHAWIDGQDAPDHVKASAVQIRKRILSSLRA